MSAVAAAVDAQLYREVMGRFATGITVITTRVDGRVYGMTANAFMAGSLQPPLCVISVRREARIHALLGVSACFGISVLSEEQQYLSNHFAGRRLPGVRPEFEELDDVPVLRRAVAVVAAEVAETVECGDHTLFIGHITQMYSRPQPPLLFYGGRYARVDRDQPIEEVIPPTFW
jgi:flavin reductase (DIM6/NTAB) family NADH-FMN oxidoreductase RutF